MRNGCNPVAYFAYVPAAGFTGTDSFTYTAADASGARSPEATVSLIVRGDNRPPDCATVRTDVPASPCMARQRAVASINCRRRASGRSRVNFGPIGSESVARRMTISLFYIRKITACT